MILNDERVKHIADKVRSLPDAVLADLGFERVMGCDVVVDSGMTHILCHPDGSHSIFDKKKCEAKFVLMERIRLYLQRVPGASQNKIRSTIGGGRKYFVSALNSMAEAGTIEYVGAGRSGEYRLCQTSRK